MSRCSTGNAQLDGVLGGGFFPGSVVVVAGAPGTGKTVLAQQMCFHATQQGRTASYYTSLSESHTKIIAHLSRFDFYDAEALESRVEFLYSGSLLDPPEAGTGIDGLVAEIRRKALTDKPAVIVVDSCRSLHDFVDPRQLRSSLYELAGGAAFGDSVLVLVGEYTPEEIGTAPEFAVADAIIQLTSEPVGEMSRRWLRVLKLRGSDYLDGRHSFDVGKPGIVVYPRLERLVGVPPARTSDARLSTGPDAIDDMIGGGIPAQDAVLVTGPSGVGKTILSLQFLYVGLTNGERCLYTSFQETPDDLIATADSFGWDLAPYRERGDLVFVHVPPVEVDLDAVGGLIAAEIDKAPFSRVVVDSLTELLVSRENERMASYVWALSALVRASGGTLMATDEAGATLVSAASHAEISVFFDNVIRLSYVEVHDRTGRDVEVAKMRRSAHSRRAAEFTIGKTGFRLGGAGATSGD
ncbi:MAG TPA: ATPase domain-containing protein [Mycobacteriales bacterium]|nr:ATPase domain-containing protein [Mycobacteriales bacterium]